MPELLGILRGLVSDAADDDGSVSATLEAAADERMAKGEVLVAHVSGTGQDAQVVAVERHLP
jgi:8-oxo-dGTP diphosphatase